MNSLSRFPLTLPVLAMIGLPLGLASGCLTNVPDPDQSGVYACEDDSACPGKQFCLQQTCVNVDPPIVEILNPEPEPEKIYTHMANGGDPHMEFLSVTASDFVLRRLTDSTEAVPGEGHLVVILDGEEVAVIDDGPLTAGIQIPIEIPDVPGIHRIQVQARLNDMTNYDHEGAEARILVWVDDENIHVALRSPWPDTVFSLEAQGIIAEVETLGIETGPPNSGKQHVHVYYDLDFPTCLDEPLCVASYAGVVPSNEDVFGPVFLPDSGTTTVTLTALVANADHTVFFDDLGNAVFSQIQIERDTIE